MRLVPLCILEAGGRQVMWKFKSCPRCRGDISVGRELDGWYEHCLQCGYLRDISSTVKLNQYGDDKETSELSRLNR